MSRARNIKPSFFRNPELVDINPLGRLLFIGLWTMADREGRLEDRPRYIKFELLPADSFDVDEALNALQERGFILRYQHDTGRFIQIINFVKHQNPHVKEAPSTIPAPGEHHASTVQTETGQVQAGLNPESPLLNEESGLPLMDNPHAGDEPQADTEPADDDDLKAQTEQGEPKPKRKSQIPDSFPVTEDMYAYGAKASSMDPDEVDAETEKFCLHHRAKGTLHLDWYAAWQYWIRCAPQFKRQLTPISGKFKGRDIGLTNEELDERIRRGVS